MIRHGRGRRKSSGRTGIKGEDGFPMEFQDKVLKCVDCGADFVFTAGEQLFFHDKQFKNEPKRCKPCKAKRAQSLGACSRATLGARSAWPSLRSR